MIPTFTIVLVLTTVVLVWIIYFDSYFGDLSIRRAIKKSVGQIPGGRYRSFSLSRPRVNAVLEGYEVQFGASIVHPSGGGLDISLFEKIKLKFPPHVSLTEKDSLALYVLDENLSIEWGWLTRYHHITQSKPAEVISHSNKILKLPQRQQVSSKPSEIVSQANAMLYESTYKNIKSLMEIARKIDNGSLDIKMQISENTSEAHREFLIGSVVTVGVIICYWVVWHFFFSNR